MWPLFKQLLSSNVLTLRLTRSIIYLSMSCLNFRLMLNFLIMGTITPYFRAAEWLSYHFCHNFNAFQSIVGKLIHNSINILKTMVTIKPPALFRRLQIARKPRLFRQLNAPFH